MHSNMTSVVICRIVLGLRAKSWIKELKSDILGFISLVNGDLDSVFLY